ncbi:MAG: hypothetical protein HY662_02195, partial [Chloroflexi bacterium]|nr:hypothetical protein [Chloroflexota bacterium]
MPLNTQSLRKVLELEINKGYLNSAVIGGLDRFLRKWAGQAAESLGTPEALRRFKNLLDKSDYASMSTERRQRWLGEVLGFLAEVETRNPEDSISEPSRPLPKPARRGK